MMRKHVVAVLAAMLLSLGLAATVAAQGPADPGCFGTDRAEFFRTHMDGFGGPGGPTRDVSGLHARALPLVVVGKIGTGASTSVGDDFRVDVSTQAGDRRDTNLTGFGARRRQSVR
jgi:hypothetical protein